MRDNHHASAAQADTAAEINRFAVGGQPGIDAPQSRELRHGHQRARQRHREHILSPVILLLIGFSIDHQGMHGVVTRIHTDIMQMGAFPIALLASKHTGTRRIAPRLKQSFKA